VCFLLKVFILSVVLCLYCMLSYCSKRVLPVVLLLYHCHRVKTHLQLIIIIIIIIIILLPASRRNLFSITCMLLAQLTKCTCQITLLSTISTSSWFCLLDLEETHEIQAVCRLSLAVSVCWRNIHSTQFQGLFGVWGFVGLGAESSPTSLSGLSTCCSLFSARFINHLFNNWQRFLNKPDQGKVYEVTSAAASPNHFLRNGDFTRFAEWRFIHRARLDCVPLSGARRFGGGDKWCRRCGHDNETLPHVINRCKTHFAAVIRRHNAVLDRLVKALMPREGTTVRVNQTFSGSSKQVVLRTV
jgi:hypothetical protein